MKVKQVIFLMIFIVCSISMVYADNFYSELKSWNYPNSSNSNWDDIACGDVDGDGIDEYAVIKSEWSQLIILSSPADNDFDFEGCKC